MKKIFLLLLLFAGFANAQMVNIPDAFFKLKLIAASATDGQNQTAKNFSDQWMIIDANGDGEIQLSEAQAVKLLVIVHYAITDLTGLSSFSNLQTLQIKANQAPSLDINALTDLTTLSIDSMRNITSLTINNANLTNVTCVGSYNLTSMNVSNLTNLTSLSVIECGLTTLNVNGSTNLEQLFCDSNQLTNLNLSGLTNLNVLYCSNNPLGSLDISGLTNLKQLFCDNNNLTNLDVSGLTNITILSCNNNNLANLNLNGLTNLDLLLCSHNLLTSLDVTNLPSLQTLYCYYNQLTTLDLSNSAQLLNLSCGENSIPVLNLNNLTNLRSLECSYLPNNLIVNGANLNALTTFRYEGQNSNITFNGFPAIQNLNLTLLQPAIIVNVTGFSSTANINIYGSTLNSLTVNGFGTSNIQSLSCSGLQLADLNINGLNNLKSLYCTNNELTNLNLTNLTSLTRLDIGNNNIESIDISGLTNLKHLDCNNNKINSLNLSGVPNLEYLDCSNTFYVQDPIQNHLTSLDLTGMTNLKYLDCSNRGFLGMLGASGNLISSLDVNQLSNLEQLKCSENKIQTLVVNGLTNLTHLDCSSNLLTSLDLIGLTNLTHLSYRSNQLSNLNMTGLINITELDCSANNIATLSVVNMPNLTKLYCGTNSLTAINLSSLTNLTDFDCSGNLLTTLNVNHLTNLDVLGCSNNQLTNIDVNNLTNLTRFHCASNQLTSLNVSALTKLTSFVCYSNQLTSLDVNSLVNLYEFGCAANQLTSIDISNLQTMGNFNCSGNQLTNIDTSNLTNLSFFSCSNNQLANLDVSTLANLYELDCDHNQITNLDVSASSHLRYLVCNDNQLTQLFMKNGYVQELNLSNNPALTYICADDAELASVQTQLNNLGMTATVCNSYCSFSPGGPHNSVVGTTIFDGNNNGCNANDPLHPNIRIDFSDGTTTGSAFTNTLGMSTFYANAGNYTISPNIENAAAFNISPASASITFPDSNYNINNQSFCLSANGVHPDLEIVIIPIGPARPGSDSAYKIVYKNKGNQVLSGNVTLTFDDARIDVNSTLPVASNQTVGNLEWAYNGLLPFESRSIAAEFNINSPMEIPAVNNDDVLNFTTSITPVAGDELPSDNAFTFNQIVVGPFDPNNITCIEGENVAPTEIGNYLHYVINFENTGTAAAENVVVSLNIDPEEFDISSLQLMDTSHNAFATVTNNVVEFRFSNINLQPTAGDPPVSGHGNILFKMKSKSELNAGDLVKNRANIFFDYNFPIETNYAETTFAVLSTDVFTKDESVVVFPNPATDKININCNNLIKSIELYDVQGRILEVLSTNNIATQVDISNKSNGIYFVKITTEKGKKVTKIIKE